MKLIDLLTTTPAVILPQRIGLGGELQIAKRSIPPEFPVSVFASAELATFLTQNPDVKLLVLPASEIFTAPGWQAKNTITGATLPMRIVKNPALTVWVRE